MASAIHNERSGTSAPQSLEDCGVASISKEQALSWFVTLNRTDVNDEQRMAFNRWLALDPVNRSSYRAVLALWERLEPTPPPGHSRL